MPPAGTATKVARTTIDDATLGRLLDGVQKPGRYIGNELHQVKKDPSTVRSRLCLYGTTLTAGG